MPKCNVLNILLYILLSAVRGIVFESSCKDELFFDQQEVSAIVMKEGASVVFNINSELTYTTINNKGDGLVTREGTSITNTGSGLVKMSTLMITSLQNGTLIAWIGSVAIASDDMLAERTEFILMATPASGYLFP